MPEASIVDVSAKKPSVLSLLLLGLPSLGINFTITTVTIYLPTVLGHLTGPAVIGLILGIEGLVGLFMPFLAGALSDRAHEVGERFRYLLPATILIVLALGLLAASRQLGVIAGAVVLFYIGYFAYLAPYWALYPDLVSKEYSGRSRSAEGLWQVIGTFLALIGGGFFIALWQPLPFVIAACMVVVVTAVLRLTVVRRSEQHSVATTSDRVMDAIRYTWHVLQRRPALVKLVAANALWFGALQAIRTFVVLFFTQGLHHSSSFVSGVIFPVAAIGLFVMAPLSGKLADSFGHKRVLSAALWVYGLGVIIPAVTQAKWVIGAIPVVAGAAAVVMVLSFSLLMQLLGDERHGAASGLFGVSRGLGAFFGPLIAGGVIVASQPLFSSTHGYASMWAVVSLFILASIPLLRRLSLPRG